ncbi:MAG: PQQ-binding-like beta-propeller repeat protein, partial [Planctomycetota bacterium]|nr:PQQ-binding-like beta-propeller repeat protein [Planctomycetota bacterium]
CFRGEDRDNINKESVPLARSWPASGPPVVWTQEMGQGHAGAAIRHGCVYVMDYDEEKQRDVYLCLSLRDGREIWRYSYPMPAKPNHGISRTVPAVNERFVIGISPTCLVTCLDAQTGEFRWRLDMVEHFGAEVPAWYTGQCALLDGPLAILAPAGPNTLLVAIDVTSGKVVWKTPNIHGSKMSHSSVVPMVMLGRKVYVYAASRGAVAAAAEDGSVVWETRRFQWHTIVPSPLALPDERILFTAGYGAKALLARCQSTPSGLALEVLRETPPRAFGSEMHTPILWQGRIYAVLPKPRQELACFDLDLNEIWASGPQERFGLGPYLIADGLIFILKDDGTLTLAEASATAYRCLARAKVLPGPDAWGPMALANGYLLVRDLYRLVCLDVRDAAGSTANSR